MGFFDKYPYTDFHELNLDWFLTTFKDLVTDYEAFKVEMTDKWNELKNNLDALEEFINNYIAGDTDNSKNQFLALHRVINFPLLTNRYTTAGTTDEDYAYLQGICSDNDTVVAAFVNIKDGNNGITKLVKYDADYNEIASAFVNVNHCNDMTYCDGYIYATAYGQTGVPDYERSIAKIDYDTLTVVEIITPDSTLPRISMLDYDAENEVFYLVYNMYTVNVFSKDFTTRIKSYNLEIPYGTQPKAKQAIIIHDKLMYMVVYPNTVIVYDLNGKIINMLNVGRVNGSYMVGELETIFKHKDELFTASCQYGGFLTSITYTQIFNINIERGVINTLNNVFGFYNYDTIYVDSDNDFTVDKNPDGTKEHPYPELAAAILNASQYENEKQIYIKGTHSSVSFDTINNAHLRPWNVTDYTVRGMRFSDSSNIYIQNAVIKDVDLILWSDKYNNAFIMGYDFYDVYLYDCEFDGGTTGCENGVRVGRCSLSLRNCTFDNFANYCIYQGTDTKYQGESITTNGIIESYLQANCDYISSDDNLIVNNSRSNAVHMHRIWDGNAVAAGAIGIDATYEPQLVTQPRYRRLYYTFEIQGLLDRETHLFPSYTRRFSFSRKVKYSGNFYDVYIRIDTNSNTTGQHVIDQSYVLDSGGTQHNQADGGDYPFVHVIEVWVEN